MVGFQNGNLPQQEYNIDFGKFPLWGLAKLTQFAGALTEIKFPDWKLEIQHAKVPSWHFATDGAEKTTSSSQLGDLRWSTFFMLFSVLYPVMLIHTLSHARLSFVRPAA